MKKYLRWISIIFLAFLLVGCESDDRVLPKLSSSLRKKIEAAWNNSHDPYVSKVVDGDILWYNENDESTWGDGVRYYGKFGNVEVLYCPALCVGSLYGVAGVAIDYGIFFYWNGEIVSSYKAYRDGVVMKEELQTIADFHKTFSTTTDRRAKVFVYEGCEEVSALSSELQREVEAFWWENSMCEVGWTSESKHCCRYYGNYNGSVVINIGNTAMGVPGDIVYGGVKIGYGRFVLLVYREGELLNIGRAYENGWLTKEDLQTIAAYHALCESKREQ